MTRAAATQGGEHAKLFERLFDEGSALGLTEAQLVDRFAANRDESAFAALVDRHGPMVLGVCRRFLRDPNDVDDAFQAVFLVLARKAAGLREKELLANWLYGVACRVAVRSRATAARRAVSDPGARLDTDARKPTAVPPAETLARNEDMARLHEEVGRLPTRYRAPVVACYFEGKTHEEAATLLGCPVGTVKGRLARARDLLRRRLERRGVVAPSVLVSATLAATDLRAAVPPALVAEAVRLTVVASSPAAWMTTAAVSTSVRSLSEGAIQAMSYAQLKTLALPVSLVAAGLLSAGAGLAAYQSAGKSSDGRPAAGKQSAADSTAAATQREPAQAVRKSTQSARPGGGPSSAIMGMDGMMGMGMMHGMAAPGSMGPVGGGGRRNTSLPISIARISSFLTTAGVNDEDRAIYLALQQQLTLELGPNSTLDDFLKRLQGVQVPPGKPLPVFVSKSGLINAGADLSTPVQLELNDVPLRSALRLVLKDLGLAYCVRDGILIISSIEDIEAELQEAQAEMISRNPENYVLDADGHIRKKDRQPTTHTERVPELTTE